MKTVLSLFGLLFIILCHPLHAGTDNNTTVHAHLHGIAELTLALEGNTLEIQFKSPAADIVGFEYTASTPEQALAVDKAKTILESPQSLFSFAGTTCYIKETLTDFSAVMGHNEHNHHSHKHDHKTHTQQDKYDNHSKKRDSHSEITASYYLECGQGAKLASLTIDFFKYFPSLETLNVMWLAHSDQGAAKLTATSNVLYIR